MFYTYVLYSVKFERIYVGQTEDLEKRIERHNSGRVKSTKPYLPWEIIHSEEFETKVESLKREKELKTHKGRDYICSKIRELY